MKHFIWILLATLVIHSCSKDDKNSDGKINSKIAVTLIEELSESNNSLNILSETIEQQPCINYSLLTNYKKDANSIRISYEDIIKPEVCFTAIGPAKTSISYDLPNGEYDVEFVNDGVLNLADLSVDNEKYIIKMLSQNNIVLKRDNLYKIPTNTYWGTIGYHQDSSQKLVEDFIDHLKQEGAGFNTYKNGDYGYFIISGSEIQPPTNHGYHFIETIIFEYKGDFEQLKDKVLQFADSNREELSIYLMNYQGKGISLWN